MLKKISKMAVIIIILFILVVTVVVNNVQADTIDTRESDGSGSLSASPNWWTSGWDFFKGSSATPVPALNDIVNLIKFVGNIVFVVVTAVLGVKYIYGSVESKASIKEGLITLVVAMIFFYGGSSIHTMLTSDNNLIFISNNYENMGVAIFSTLMYFINIAAVGGVIFVGIKYMLAGAEGKSELKMKGVPFVIGIIMSFATITFLNFIVNSMNAVL